MLYVPSTCCTDNINAIAEFVPNASESVFCHRLYCSRDSVCELIQVSGYWWNINTLVYISP